MSLDYAPGEVEPSVMFILQDGESISQGSVLNSRTGQTYNAWPIIPTQYTRLSGGEGGVPGQYLFTDNTIRDAKGNVLRDLTREGQAPLNIGGGVTSSSVRRNADGSATIIGSSTVLSSAGIATGVAQAAAQLGVDPFAAGGPRLYAVRRVDGQDSNIVGTAGPYVWSDGSIRTIDGQMISDADRRVQMTTNDTGYIAPQVPGTREAAKAGTGPITNPSVEVVNTKTMQPVLLSTTTVPGAAIDLPPVPWYKASVMGVPLWLGILAVVAIVAAKEG